MSDLCNKAIRDIKTMEWARSQLGSDEDYMDIACYHAQQAIEKLLKFIIEISGVEYPKTHDITRLLVAIETLPGIILPDTLIMMSETLTLWESSSRYRDIFKATIRQLEIASKISDDLLSIIECILAK
jgi:HEPN domain-containing protein